MELEKDLSKVRKEKDEEIERRTLEKEKYEKKIKELEDKIRVLQSESGDQVQQLEEKIKELIIKHEQESETL